MMAKHALVNQRSLAPTAKVFAAWATGGGATLILGILAAVTDSVSANTFWGGLTAYVASGAAAYIKKSRTLEGEGLK